MVNLFTIFIIGQKPVIGIKVQALLIKIWSNVCVIAIDVVAGLQQ